jgi:hypothetical protein
MTSEGTKGTKGTDTEGLSDMLHLSFYKKNCFQFYNATGKPIKKG